MIEYTNNNKYNIKYEIRFNKKTNKFFFIKRFVKKIFFLKYK